MHDQHTSGAGVQWGSATAWLGVTAGSTSWLVISAAVLAVRGEPLIALAVAVCFVVPLLAALRAWSRRDRVDPSSATESWFVIAWLFSLVATAVIHASGTHALVNLPGDQIWIMWLCLLLGGPLLWLAIHRRRRDGEAATAGLFDFFASWF